MKITFLGTSHGVPERDRYCSCTLVEADGRKYLIDAGGPVMDILLRRGIAPADIAAIFVTHVHGDHTDGLISFTDLISWYFKTADPEIYLPEQGLIDALRGWNIAVHGHEPRPLKYKTFEEGEIYDDGVLKVSAVRTKHIAVSYAFVLEAEGKRVVFTGDLNKTNEDFPKICFERDCDAIICEAAHFSAIKASESFDKCRTRRVYINHIAPVQAPSIEQLQGMGKPYSVTAVTDGFETEI